MRGGGAFRPARGRRHGAPGGGSGPARLARPWRALRLAAAMAAVVAAAAVVVTAGPSCRRAAREPPQPGPPGAAAETVPRRIVSLAPSLTETLFALGLGPRVVGVDDYSAWPPETAAKVRIGGLFNPNLEKLVSLHADLAVLLPSERDVAAKLRGLGIASLVVPTDTLADVERAFVAIARRCGVAPAGERLAAAWRAELAPRPVPGAPRVMLSLGRQPGRMTAILAPASGTYLDELLGRLGAVNVFAGAASRYPQVGLEEVMARAPQVILELRAEPAPPPVAAALIGDWRQLSPVPAVRDGRIFVIAGDYVLVPGPRLPQLYRRMREALVASRGLVEVRR